MLRKLSGLVELFCVGWLTCCAASARRTILSVLIRSFIAICSGGTSSWLNGTGLASGFFREIHLQQTSKFPMDRQVPWALALTWQDSGFLVHRGPRSKSSLSRIRNFIRWSSLLMSGAISGAGSMFCSDNDSVVHILLSTTSKIPSLMHLLRVSLLAAARHSFSFSAQHIPGVTNSIGDALSHFHWQDFHRLAPEAHPHPNPIPPQLLEDLLSPR